MRQVLLCMIAACLWHVVKPTCAAELTPISLQQAVGGETGQTTVEVHVGSVSELDQAKWEIQLCNDTADMLRFEEVRIPCRCTTASLTSTEIPSGSDAFFKVAIARKPDDVGKFNHAVSLDLTTKGKQKSVRVAIIGTWDGPFRIDNKAKIVKKECTSVYPLITRSDFDPQRLEVIAAKEVLTNWVIDTSEDNTYQLSLTGSSAISRNRFPVLLKYRTNKESTIPEFVQTLILDVGTDKEVLRVFPGSVSSSESSKNSVTLRIFLGHAGEPEAIEHAVIMIDGIKNKANAIEQVNHSVHKIIFPPWEFPDDATSAALVVEFSNGRTVSQTLKLRK